jgi:hypothetical protein
MANVRLNVFRGDAAGGEIKAYDVETDPAWSCSTSSIVFRRRRRQT